MLAGSQEGLAPLSGRCCPYLIFLPTHSTEASFFDYKKQLIHDLLASEQIVSLLSDDEQPIADPEELFLTRLYPFEYVPEVVTQGQTFICCDVDIQSTVNKTFLTPNLYIWVFTHKTKIMLPDGSVRTDRLCSEIAKVLNGSRYYGLGELELYSVRRFTPIQDYLGKVITFQTKDFNRLSPSAKPVPSNRKNR